MRAALDTALAARFPNVGVNFTYPEDNLGRKQLYLDAKGDQEVWDLIALLFLMGAALGAFNLAGRIVAAQRRQIGIGMALGVPRRWLASRPLLVGLQIAALGTLFGLAIGPVLMIVFISVLKSIAPLPYYDISFYMPAYVNATVFGVTLPLLATEKAAEDLGVGVGDTVTLEHPRREGLLAFRLVKSQIPVTGIHDNPVRSLSYMDLSSASWTCSGCRNAQGRRHD